MTMPKAHTFTEAQIKEIEDARKKNKNKNVARRLEALYLRTQGQTREKIAERTGYNPQHITELTAKYMKGGLQAVAGNNYKGNHHLLSFEEEEEILKPFIELSEKGQIVEVSAIKKAFEKKFGKENKSHGHIYAILKRHGWRKTMPRSKHPNKATEEVIEASKKLTPQSKK
jgi:transposase